MIDLVKNYGILARRMKKSVIRELLKLTNQPDIISFAGGLPDPFAFPLEEVEDIFSTVIKEHGKEALQYGATEGLPCLKAEIRKLLADDGVEVDDDHILVTVASQQGLDLIGRVFIDPSDPILLELPSYIGGLQAFQCYGAKMIGIPMDDEGLRTDILEKNLKKLKDMEEHYKLVYTIPDFQNPSGVTMSLARRKHLVQLAKEYDVLVVEDTPYRELRFEGETLPNLYSLDDTGNVISLRTFSKIFVPGLRVGWVVAHPAIISKFVVAKQALDLCTPTLCQFIVYEYCRRGLLKPHIEKIKKIYRKKRDLMLAALEEYMPQDENLRWTRPEGGLFLFLYLPRFINADKMMIEAVKNKVAYVIGSAFYCNDKGQNTMRLNFSYSTEEQINEGIKRLASVIKEKISKHKRRR